MSEHTPGPWEVGEQWADYHRPVVATDKWIAEVNAGGDWHKEGQANARLIAAAPDYHEGASEAVRHNVAFVYDSSGRPLTEWVAIPKTAHDKLRAALAKAEGRAT